MRTGVVVLLLAVSTAIAPAQPRSEAERERFLLTAAIASVRPVGKGISGVRRATLSSGGFSHDASIQTIDEFKERFRTPSGVERNFRDTWKFNVAAYRLSRMIGMHMLPPSVERPIDGVAASFTWWVDDVAMDEGERVKRQAVPPNAARWNEQMYMVRVFDQLIDNIDRNPQNLVIDKDWRLWMIDHSRAFRLAEVIRHPENLIKCERGVLEALRHLDPRRVSAELGAYLTGEEIAALLKRRDGIVAWFDARGDSVLFTASPD